MLWNVLSATSSSGAGAGGNSWGMGLMAGILVLIFVAFMIYSRRSQKKNQQEAQNVLNAIKPGNKVKTIGGICGVVVEVCDDNTFVLETGTEKSGKSFIKFDMQAIYQTDAVVEKKEDKKEVKDEKTEEIKEEKPAEEVVDKE